jgi:hypothetical protein
MSRKKNIISSATLSVGTESELGYRLVSVDYLLTVDPEGPSPVEFLSKNSSKD